MADFLPRADAEFEAWQINFAAYAGAHLAGLGLVAGDLAPVSAAATTWSKDFAAHVAAQATAQAATQVKNASRAALVALIRPLVARLQASPSVDDGERATLGITVADASPTPVGPPATHPVAMVECSGRLRHTVSFMDEMTPTKKAKPPGVLGAEIWVKVGGPPPVDPGELHFLALDTATPYVAEYPGASGGQMAHYWLRWVSHDGQKGPWSDTASATIGA